MNSIVPYQGKPFIPQHGPTICFYEILGVRKDSDTGLIKSALNKMISIFHPDSLIQFCLGPSSKVLYSEFFEHLLKIKETLLDPEKRRLYNDYGLIQNTVSESAIKLEASSIAGSMFLDVVEKIGTGKIDSTDILNILDRSVDQNIAEIEDETEKAKNRIAHLEKVKRKVRLRRPLESKEENETRLLVLLNPLVDNIRRELSTIEQNKKKKLVGEQVKLLLKEFVYEFVDEASMEYDLDGSIFTFIPE